MGSVGDRSKGDGGAAGTVFSDGEWSEIVIQLGLPPRQAEVLAGVLGGLSDAQICAEAGMSLSTARSHMARLFRHFGVRDRTSLVLAVLRHFRAECRRLDCPRMRAEAAPCVRRRQGSAKSRRS